MFCCYYKRIKEKTSTSHSESHSGNMGVFLSVFFVFYHYCISCWCCSIPTNCMHWLVGYFFHAKLWLWGGGEVRINHHDQTWRAFTFFLSFILGWGHLSLFRSDEAEIEDTRGDSHGFVTLTQAFWLLPGRRVGHKLEWIPWQWP